MSGDDPAGAAFGHSYDNSASKLLEAMATTRNGLCRLGDGVRISAHNYSIAEANSNISGHSHPLPGPHPTGSISAGSTPSSVGHGAGPPAGWAWVSKYIGMIWPTGDSAKLRGAAAAWTIAGTNFEVSEILGAAGPMSSIGAQQIPEGPAIAAAFSRDPPLRGRNPAAVRDYCDAPHVVRDQDRHSSRGDHRSAVTHLQSADRDQRGLGVPHRRGRRRNQEDRQRHSHHRQSVHCGSRCTAPTDRDCARRSEDDPRHHDPLRREGVGPLPACHRGRPGIGPLRADLRRGAFGSGKHRQGFLEPQSGSGLRRPKGLLALRLWRTRKAGNTHRSRRRTEIRRIVEGTRQRRRPLG